MRRLLLLILLFLVGINSYPTIIQPIKARIIALNWFNTQGEAFFDEGDIGNVYTKLENSVPIYYIVSFNPSGWVIVSASDLVEPVLGYSVDSKFEIEKMPPHVNSWMGLISSDISFAEKEKIAPSTDISKKWNEYGTEIQKKGSLKSTSSSQTGPLTATTWNQGKFYNEMAPVDENSSAGNDHVWIGCVATAMAQVMKYWEYPSSGMGNHSYTHSKYGTLSVDFGNTTYNWGAMPNSVNSQNTEVQRINYHAAVAVNMDFGPASSGAYLEDANTGLISYFRYNNTIFEASKSRWDNDEWIAQLKRELDAGRPVIYSGYNSTYTSGHAWVCDGYSSGNYFHFNWGWGGSFNGNFLLTSLTPGSYNFSTDQAALFSIEPVLPASIPIPYSQGFESGSGDISLMGVHTTTPEEVHTGSQSLQLGKESIVSYSLNSASLCFVVPADAELNFWVKRRTPEISANNQQMAFLMPQYGTTPLATIYNGDFNDTSWVSYNVDLSAYTGQVVRLLFEQQVYDFTKQQWMYIDDISISGISSNIAPYTPSAPIPSNLQDLVILTPTLRWNGGDPNGDELTYNIYFGTQINPPLVASTFNNYYTPPVLTHSTTYYWKIVSDDGSLTTDGPVWSFITKGIPPDVGNCGLTNLTSSSATICGEIINENGTTISSKGICWTETSLPSLSTEYKEATGTSAVFSCDIDSLLPFTNYNYNAFANSNQGVAYSPTLSFRTLPELPEIEITEVVNILRSSATVAGKINRVNDASVTSRGVVWSETAGFDPTLAPMIVEEGDWQNPGNFIINLNNLPGPANFFVRVFARNSKGIAYSEEMMFTTPNLPPFIDLDANNSRGAWGSDFLGTTTEQLPGGVLCDADVVINDPDGDEILQLVLEVMNPINLQKEILTLTSLVEGLTVWGDSTGHIELTATDTLSYSQWQEILSKIEYLNLLDSPHPETVRNISVRVFDGIDWSNIATAHINVVQVNDAPVVLTVPGINKEPVLGSTINIVPGIWADTLDGCNGNYSFSYWWQVKDSNGNIENIEPENLFYLSIDHYFCGKLIRVIEEVTDLNCGGANRVVDSAAGEWTPVGRVPQSISLDNIPLHYFHERYFRLSGNSTSGLPLMFSVPANNTISISNDTVYMLNSGTVVISGIQEGNECYLPSSIAHKIVTIARGNQEIVFKSPIEARYDEYQMAIPAEATSRLDLEVVSSDPTVVTATNDSLYIMGTGEVELTISQPGNQNYYAATSVKINLTVLKGNQKIFYNPIGELQYGQGNVPIDAWSSSLLDLEIASSDPTIVEVIDNSLKVNGVGNVIITITQKGNNLWNPAEVVQLPLNVNKGIQEISVAEFGNKLYSDQPFAPVCSTTSGLAVSFSVVDTSIANVVDGKIVIRKAGQTTIFFIQEGNPLWERAEKEVTLLVGKSDQIITFSEIVTKVYGDHPILLDAVASSGLAVAYEIADPEVATLEGDSLVLRNAGSTIITAMQPGNDQWNEALPVSVNLVVSKASQTLNIDLLDSILLTEQLIWANVTASSGLPVAITSSNESIVYVHGDTLYLHAVGEVDLHFEQIGNRNYQPAYAERKLVVYEPVSTIDFDENRISIYPNPSTGIFNVLSEKEFTHRATITVTNLVGEKIVNSKPMERMFAIDLSGYPRGVYFVIIDSNNGHKVHKLILKGND
jgi:hypothetical protein